jgi:hypothetical protein
MSRPYTDIATIDNSKPIKNGSAIVSTTVSGEYNTLDTVVKNVPDINTIYNKYGNRFYNGLFVNIFNDIVGA